MILTSHKLELNPDRLLALLSHKILVKIWDGKEYCTVRTKLDKPRIGRALPALLSSNEEIILIEFLFLFETKDNDEENSAKNIVHNMAQNYADKWVAKPMLYKLYRKLPITIPSPSPFLQRKSLII